MTTSESTNHMGISDDRELRPQRSTIIKQRFKTNLTQIVLVIGFTGLTYLIALFSSLIMLNGNNTTPINVLGLSILIFAAILPIFTYVLTHDTVTLQDNSLTVEKHSLPNTTVYTDNTGHGNADLYRPVKRTNDRQKINDHDGIVLIDEYPTTVDNGQVYHTTHGYMEALDNIELTTAAILVEKTTQ